jgi:curli biogenesis system outer membrane secretion channel CsgG
MSHPARIAGAVAAVLLFAAALGFFAVAATAPLAGAAQSAGAQDPRPHCCYTNPRYVGTCDVEPAKDETCASILEYLNNPQSQGKSYCGSTNVRGGWKQTPCEPEMKRD